MKVLIIRHAIAEEKEEFAQTGQADEDRPLTDAGRKRMKRAARGLRELVPEIDILGTSPLTRAVQTAEVIAKQYDSVTSVVVEALKPEQPFDDFAQWLQRIEDADLVAAVGHEPHLSSLASWLMTGTGKSLLEMKKGSALLLEFEGVVVPGSARLLWFVTPAQLRLLGD